MKKTQIFKEAFSDILIPQGFIFKNKTFIRVIGENIVQSLYLESFTPDYRFELNLAPAASLRGKTPRPIFQTMKMQFRGEHWLGFNNFAGFPYVTGGTMDYRANVCKNPENIKERYNLEHYIEGREPEKCIANMQKAAELFARDYLPILNATTDFNSFLKFRETYFEDETLFLGRIKPQLLALELSYKAYLDGNSKYGVEYLRNYSKSDFVQILKGQFENWEIYDFEKFYKDAEERDMELVRNYGCDEKRVRRFSPSFVEKKLVNVNNIIYGDDYFDKDYEAFWNCVYTNDFSDIPKQWAEEEQFVLDLIKEAFPKIKLP